MIEINLLPKDYLKRSSNFSFGKKEIYVVAGAVAVVALLAVVTLYQMRQVDTLEASIQKAGERAAMLQRDIKLVDALLDVKTKISDRLSAIEKLDRHRSVWVRLLQEVAGNVPDFVWLGELREKAEEKRSTNDSRKSGNKAENTAPAEPVVDSLPSFVSAEVEGHAFTLNALASFMINLMRSDYFDKVELVSTKEITFPGSERAYNFIISCNIHYLSDDQLRNMVAQAEDEESFNEADFQEAEYQPSVPSPAPANQE
ncbi:MAG: PilN domain-containing protein [bacterium]|nr:PilN domain-containing protein [bacterium]